MNPALEAVYLPSVKRVSTEPGFQTTVVVMSWKATKTRLQNDATWLSKHLVKIVYDCLWRYKHEFPCIFNFGVVSRFGGVGLTVVVRPLKYYTDILYGDEVW